MKANKKRVLISVTDKAGIVEFVHELTERGYEIISTGGTAKKLKQAEIKVREVEDITGYPEILDGRVKTLHPKVFGALLAIRGNERHQKDMVTHDIEPIELVVVNLYPFEEVVTKERLDEQELIEYIDRSEEHTSELQSPDHLVCRLLLEKKKKTTNNTEVYVSHNVL